MPIIQNDVINVIRNLKANSPVWDSIPAVVVKATYQCFMEPLTHILNLSVMYGVFPSELKLAKVIPLFKANDPMLFSNYRPVSVLPVFSKILERIMYNQLLSFINKHKLLYSYQFGFRINHAPELALLCLADKISDALENGEYVLGLFLDFSKAFDTVNHEILFAKLKFPGIRGVCLQWFRSYLSKRPVDCNTLKVMQCSLTFMCNCASDCELTGICIKHYTYKKKLFSMIILFCMYNA